MIHLPSASSVQRAMACAPSVALPRVERTGEAVQERGIAVHAFIAAAKEIGREKALEAVPKKWRIYCESIPLQELHLERFLPEPAFALDVETGKARLLGVNIGRRYAEHGLDPTREIACTPDGVGVSADSVYVVDWKSGPAEVEPPETNWQLLVGALCATSVLERDQAVPEIVHLPQSAEGKPWRQRLPGGAVWTRLDLDDAWQRLRERLPAWQEAHRAVAAGEPVTVTTGPHCDYCPCVADCPATGKLLQKVTAWMDTERLEEEGAVARLAATLTPESARKARELLVRYGKVLEIAERALKAYSTTSPVPLGNGKVYGARTIEMEELDPHVVYAVVKEYAGEEMAVKAVSWEASKSQLERAAKEIAAANCKTIAETVRGLLTTIRERGGSRLYPAQRFETFKPKGE